MCVANIAAARPVSCHIAMGRLSEQIILHWHISSHVVHNSNRKGGNVRGLDDASIGVVGNSGGSNGQAQAAPVSSAPTPLSHVWLASLFGGLATTKGFHRY